jgi:hypothetical protein
VAGDARLVELPPQSVWTRELLGLLSSEQHPSHVLYGRHNGRRFAVYVPEDLVDEVRRAFENGRALQDLLTQAGPSYINALKREQASAVKCKKS